MASKIAPQGDVSSAFSNLSFGELPRGMQETLDGCPPRPGYGTSGKGITVNANMFLARFRKQGLSVNHYDIEINPVIKTKDAKKPRPLLQKIWNQMVADASGPVKEALEAAAYDQQKSFYTPHILPMEGGKLEIIVGLVEDGIVPTDDRRRFRAVIQPAENMKIDLDTIMDYCKGDTQTEQARDTMLRAVMAMNVLFRQDPAQRFTMSGAAGRKFFTDEDGTPLSNGAILYKGFQQSFRWTSAGFPAVQIDTAYSAFVEPGMLVDVAPKVLGLVPSGGFGGRGGARGGRGGPRGGFMGGAPGPARPIQELNPAQTKRLNDILRGAKFTVTHRKTERVFSIIKLTSQPADNIKFTLNGKDGQPDRTVSVAQYFQEQYNVRVTRPRLPCVQYGKNFIPMEFVKLEPFNSIPMMRITPDQTAEIIKDAAKPPPMRQGAIAAWRQKLNYSNLPKLKAWQVEVNTNMMAVPARVLPAPSVIYEGNKTIRANFGGWNMKGVRFTKAGKPLVSWAVISFDERCTVPDLQKFVTYFVNVLGQYNCPVQNKRPVCFQYNPNAGGPNMGIKPALQQAAKNAYMETKANPQIIFCILPKKDPSIYQAIKACAAEQLFKPVVTQCLQSLKIKSDRGIEQYCGNVAMKVHAKLGGLTHQVSHQLERTTMMVGADTGHPPAKGGALPPSIAVTVAAVNGENNRFVSGVRLQEGRVEIIQDLENMMATHIQNFEKNTGAKPLSILFFRDGVSEGQYAHCVNQELKSIKKAAARFGNYNPKVTFVICAKRHSMRFFASSDADKDRTGNLPPGTVVDSLVTSPIIHDFYLQAHAGLQGTARPTHYVVVADENKYSADKLQGLVNVLCYSYARATRSVSLVPVAYYADIVAEKAREWIYNDDSETATVPSTASGSRVEQMSFDALRISKRFESNPEFNNVAWFM
ncbi:argonaute [Cryptococcus gattii Ru294]|uniref:Argonaute n=1 Tax=Cryptococcus gattii EJB2 TaxID=1296103 RepID=A0ABR5BY94_9TREE|nr:argonaute [Cryptococcus gattii Ru294]KIR80584.1 argonaute [Cryptococcus gattii EJB2]KJE03523.1 argonaute [Cryptococcus gattii NT-10]